MTSAESQADVCPRCGKRDLCMDPAGWGICLTCGFQTDRPYFAVGRLTPPTDSLVVGALKRRIASRGAF